MKRLATVMFVILTIALLCCRCSAAQPNKITYEIMRQSGADKLMNYAPPEAVVLAEKISEGKLSAGEFFTLSPTMFFKAARLLLTESASLYLRELFSLFAAVLLCAMLVSLSVGKELSKIYGVLTVLAITLTLSRPVLGCVSQCLECIRSCSMFLLGFVPVFASLAAASGTVAASGAYCALVMAAAQVASQLASLFFLPLAQCYMLLSLSGSICQNNGIILLCSAVKKFINWSLAAVMAGFSGVLALQNALCAASDGAVASTARFLVGTFVPVVGSAIADAFSAVQGSVGVIKAGVGSFGIVVAALIFFPLLAKLFFLRLVVFSARVFGETLSANQAVGMLNGFSNLLSIITAVVISMLVLSVVSTAIMLLFAQGGAI